MSSSTAPKDATSYKETAFGIIPRHELLIKEAEGVVRGFYYIADVSPKISLEPEFLLELHKVCFGWIFPEWGGKYRTIEVQTSSHEFPHHSEVPILLTDFFRDLDERMKHDFDPIEIIAWAQYRIVWIHPFCDYNGRTARLFCNYLMLRFGIPIAEIKVGSEEERAHYIKTIKLADEGDLAPLQKLIQEAVAEASG